MYLGCLPYLVFVGALATIAEVEFSRLIARRGLKAVHIFGVGLVWVCLLDGAYPRWDLLGRGIASLLLVSLSWQVLRHHRSTAQDWAGAIAGGLYIGLCGSYLIKLRALPADGLWWTFITVPVTLFADSAAYIVGSIWGRQKLAPKLSSGKTVEGYVGAVVLSALVGAFLAWMWSFRAGSESAITWSRGLVLGVLIAALAPLGDLAISTIKREAGVDNTSNLLPGHGGVLDRLDTVLFAAVISHLYLTFLGIVP
jgi:phosphatidate cytidylyltransferase